MADKLWQGADLIFDLDGDHLPGVTDRDFPGYVGSDSRSGLVVVE